MKTEEKTLDVNFGPQHPSTHGVLYLKVSLIGETIQKVTPHLGYLHRGFEKLAENRTYRQILPVLNRLDYISAYLTELSYVLAVEKLMDIEPPDRAIYIRVLMAELQRIANHLMILGTFAMDLGAITPIFYEFIQREYVMDISDMISGQRLMPNYLRVGGVKKDISDDVLEKIKNLMEKFDKEIDMFEELVSGNEIFTNRTKNIGKLSTAKAIELGITGPYLRATGFDWDLRKKEPYSRYDEFDFNIVTGKNGDSFDAYQIRVNELRESRKIVLQAIEKLKPGPINLTMPLEIRPPKGDVYSRIESTRGELGVYIVSDGSEMPYRLHMRAPALLNLQALPYMLKGSRIPDFCPIISALDPIMGEVDR